MALDNEKVMKISIRLVSLSFTLILTFLLLSYILLFLPSSLKAENRTYSFQTALMMILASSTALLLFKQMKSILIPRKAEEKILSILKCKNCDYSETVEFKKGFFIGKKAKECPKCKGDVTVDLIYLETPKKSREASKPQT